MKTRNSLTQNAKHANKDKKKIFLENISKNQIEMHLTMFTVRALTCDQILNCNTET